MHFAYLHFWKIQAESGPSSDPACLWTDAKLSNGQWLQVRCLSYWRQNEKKKMLTHMWIKVIITSCIQSQVISQQLFKEVLSDAIHHWDSKPALRQYGLHFLDVKAQGSLLPEIYQWDFKLYGTSKPTQIQDQHWYNAYKTFEKQKNKLNRQRMWKIKHIKSYTQQRLWNLLWNHVDEGWRRSRRINFKSYKIYPTKNKIKMSRTYLCFIDKCRFKCDQGNTSLF